MIPHRFSDRSRERVPPVTETVLVEPRALPIHLTEAKRQVRVAASVTAEDAHIEACIRAAVERAEGITGRLLVLQTWVATWDWHFPWLIEPTQVPLRRVDALQYVDNDGVLQTLDASKYVVDTDGEPARIYPAYGEVWPVTRNQRRAVILRYSAGYLVPFTDDDVDTGTDTITAADHPYSDGDRVPLSNSGGELPTGLDADATYHATGVSGDNLQLEATSGGGAVDITAAAEGGTHFLGRMPQTIRQAVLLAVGTFYEHRETTVVGDSPAELAAGIGAAGTMLLSKRVLWA